MSKNSWLLAFCGVLQALLGLTNFFMIDHGSLISRLYSPIEVVTSMCMLAIAAGACAVAAGIWSSKESRFWFVALNGLALSAYGLIPTMWRGPLSLRPYYILLLVAMAMSIGIFALTSVLAFRGHVPDKWFLGVAGAASVSFALAFVAFDFRWITLEPDGFFLLTGAYFVFTAICLGGWPCAAIIVRHSAFNPRSILAEERGLSKVALSSKGSFQPFPDSLK